MRGQLLARAQAHNESLAPCPQTLSVGQLYT